MALQWKLGKTQRQLVDELLRDGFRIDVINQCFTKNTEEGLLEARVGNWGSDLFVTYDLIESDGE